MCMLFGLLPLLVAGTGRRGAESLALLRVEIVGLFGVLELVLAALLVEVEVGRVAALVRLDAVD